MDGVLCGKPRGPGRQSSPAAGPRRSGSHLPPGQRLAHQRPVRRADMEGTKMDTTEQALVGTAVLLVIAAIILITGYITLPTPSPEVPRLSPVMVKPPHLDGRDGGLHRHGRQSLESPPPRQ